jgi:N-formylglutamate deformylase
VPGTIKVTETYRFTAGSTRLLVSIPHAGTFVPEAIAADMTAAGLALPDTDWHVDRLYDFVADIGATLLVANHSRYVVDLNRPADGSPLYPGQQETGLCPVQTFGGERIYREGREPDAQELQRRIGQYWRPYHDRLRGELTRIRQQHGSAVLWDAHSIGSRVPSLFDGELPVLNLGTWNGRSCDPALEQRLYGYVRDHSGYSAVLNGRFTGGAITRTCGDPANNVQAVQLELAQRSYMDEASRGYLADAAARTRAVIRALLEIATTAG